MQSCNEADIYTPPCSVKATCVLTSPFPLLVDAATDT